MSMSLWTLLLFLLAAVSCGNAGKFNSETCPKPILEGNVVLSDSAIQQNNFFDDSEITLVCATGYVVDNGSATIRCLNGEWSKQELTCKKLDCGLPSPLPHMKYNIPYGTLFGAYIKPYCERGYNAYGSSFRQCLTYGWTGRPRCELVTCGKPIMISHCIIVSDMTKKILEFEDVIEYRCEDNYKLEGNGSVVCQENGKFSTLPKCKAECPEPVLEGNVVLSTSAIQKKNFPDESEVTLECATGYVVDHGKANIICLNGEWSKQELTCKMVTCGKPIKISHCIIVSNLTKKILEFEDVIEYRCEDNYKLEGNGSVVCQENGKFSTLPKCKAECPEPVLKGNVVLSTSAIQKKKFPDESEVTLECATGYVVDHGEANIICLNGEWSKQELTCKKITCGDPINIPYSNKDTYLTKEILEFGDVIEYWCVEKYMLIGNRSVVCQENGTFSSLPECREILDDNKYLSGKPGAGVVVGVVGVCAVVCIVFIVHKKKRKGSYDTGEEKKPHYTKVKDSVQTYDQFII